MSKKHFILIADELRAELKRYMLPEEKRGFDSAVLAVALALQQAAPRFDHERFLNYVYSQGEK